MNKIMLIVGLLLMTLQLPAETLQPTELLINLENDIYLLSEVDLSCDVESDCLSLPYGQKACGGPKDYVIYSKKNQYAEQLKEIIRTYTSLVKQSLSQDMVSDCGFELAPETVCQQSRCTKK